MKRSVLVFMLASLMIILCGCKSSDYRKATKLMQNGEYEKAAVAYNALEDYKDAEERATMLEVKMLIERYQDFYDEMGTLTSSNFLIEMKPLGEILIDFKSLDMDQIAKYPILDEYVQTINTINVVLVKLILLHTESIEKYMSPGFYMFPSTMERTMKEAESVFRSWLKEILATEFPYDDLFE